MRREREESPRQYVVTALREVLASRAAGQETPRRESPRATLEAAIDSLESISLGVTLFPLNDTRSTLAELGERRAALAGRIAEVRAELRALIERGTL
ncbi:MAG: hypothetical protein KIT84_26445 [Labilithrix sp.]|nr:hypothetical protein [Labilithrix sp.]MCW5814593.1 hypothetical protein [Labilithrix sp.]